MTTDLTRPIIGIENRTAQEVFDIMCDRFRRAPSPSPAPGVVCQHEPYQGRCIHCDVKFIGGRPALAPLSQPAKGEREGGE